MRAKLDTAAEWCIDKILWWAQVTDTPEDNRTTLFNKGTPTGSKVEIPIGGQDDPNSKLGASLE